MKNLFLVVVLAWACNGFAQNPAGNSIKEHRVQPGETIYSISKAFGIEQGELVKANPVLVHGLKVGQELQIPVVEDEGQDELPNFIRYKVKRNNTLHYIAKQYDVEIEDILKYNPEAGNGIKPGQILRIPVKADLDRMAAKAAAAKTHAAAATSQGKVHLVTENESLYSISKRYQCSIVALLDLNPEARNGLHTGMQLKIPEATASEQADRSPDGNNFFMHRVERGETFWGLEKKYRITQAELVELNPALKDGLKTGLQIRIPLQNVPDIQVVPSDESAFQKYQVGRGETLYGIARRKKIKISELKRVNPVLGYRGLVAGETILIPIEKSKTTELPVSAFSKEVVEQPAQTADHDVDVYVPPMSNCRPNPLARSSQYRIGLMLPLYLPANDTINRIRVRMDEMLQDSALVERMKNGFVLPVDSFRLSDEKQVYARSENFLHFYEGVLLAADSLQRAGMKLQLHVFDTNQSPSVIDSLLQLNVFKELDLIIGPVFPELQQPVVDFANKYHIPLVSPLSTAGAFEQDSPNYFKVNSTKDYLIRKTAEYITEEYFDKNLIVLRMGEYKHLPEAELVNLCREKLFLSGMNNQTNQLLFHEYDLQAEGTWGLSRILRNDLENVFIIPTSTEAQLSVAITNLNGLAAKYPITVVGLSSYQRFKSIQPEYFHHLKLNLLSPYFVDYSSPFVNRFIGKFRNNFAAEPNQFSFQGYDIAFYFMSAMFRFGKDFFGCLPNLQVDLTQCELSFDKVSRQGGYMNQGLFVLEYERNYNIARKRVVGQSIH